MKTVIIAQLKREKVVPNLCHGHAVRSQISISKINFQLSGNLTDDIIILDTVQLPVKNHLFVYVSSDGKNRVAGDRE